MRISSAYTLITGRRQQQAVVISDGNDHTTVYLHVPLGNQNSSTLRSQRKATCTGIAHTNTYFQYCKLVGQRTMQHQSSVIFTMQDRFFF